MVKKCLRVQKTEIEAVEVDVRFPIYRRQFIDDDCTLYTLVSETAEVCITERVGASHSARYAIEMYEKDFGDGNADLAWWLGRERFSCSAEQFHEVYEAAMKAINNVVLVRPEPPRDQS